MQLRPLGTTGLMVSPLGLGTVKFGRNSGVKYPRPFSLPSDAEIVRLLAVAREEGINLLDTAPAYGLAEERLGRLLERREDWTIVGKAGESFADGRSGFDFSPAAIVAQVETSLRRLRTDRLEVLLLHSDGADAELVRQGEAFEAMRRLQREGKVRACGISSKDIAGGLAAIALCDVVMLSLNAADRTQLPVVRAAAAAGRGVLAKKPLASGHGVGADAAALAQAFAAVLDEPGVCAAIVGTLDPAHLRADCAAVRAAGAVAA